MTTATTIKVQLQIRQDTAANWSAINPVLLDGEIGRESDTGKIRIGNGVNSWVNLPYQPFGALITNADISATAEIAVSKLADGAARQLLQTDAAGTGVEWTSNVDVPGTLDVTGAATFDAAVTIAGDLTVNGTTTNINTTNLVVEDKNVILGDVATPTDTTADGGGITLKGATDKTINWVDATDAWTSSERFSYPLGSATDPALTFTGDPNTGIYSPGADQLAISTNGAQRINIEADGDINIDSGGVFYDATNNRLAIGTTSPGATLDVNGKLRLSSTEDNQLEWVSGAQTWRSNVVGGGKWYLYDVTNTKFPLDVSANTTCKLDINTSHFAFTTNNNERARIDSSGRLLVGTSSARGNLLDGTRSASIQAEGTTTDNSSISVIRNAASTGQPSVFLGKSRGASVNSNTVVAAEDGLGNIQFLGADGTKLITGASIGAVVDGTPGANDMPGRLVFSTTADGASSPTRRMTIKQDGSFVFGDFDSVGSTASGGKVYIEGNSTLYVAVGGGTVAYFNRNTDDGEIVALRQANITEGSISVSGSTVTYGGGHLARWSQLPNDEDPSEILKGTVMSNLDAMCEWGEEDNEQLNKTKVSDVEGDSNVAGVFVSTSFSEEGPLDFFVGMTGDMIIRIAEGVTVQRGDLLMSAGDGTAKPQDDDIIRSKTVAKVTSTHVTCTYDDGSYCVPCVLMAC